MLINEFASFIYDLGEQSLTLIWTPLGLWTILTLGYLTYFRTALKIPPVTHYQISTALILALPLGALLTVVAPFSISAPEAFRVLEVPTLADDLSYYIPEAASTPGVIWHFYHLLGLLTMSLLVVSVFKVVALLWETLRLRRLTTSMKGIKPAEISESLEQLRLSWGIKDDVAIVFSREDHVPMTFGWRKAFIIIPSALREQPEALHMTLVHEMAHIRNADFARQWIEKAIASLFFFHPLVVSLSQTINQFREMHCDAEVLSQHDISPRRYASLLLEYAMPKPAQVSLSISMSAEEGSLKERISAMKHYPDQSNSMFRSRRTAFLISGILLALCTLIVACEVKFEEDNSITIIDAPASLPAVEVTPQQPATLPSGDVFMVVDNMPQLIGGIASLQEEIKYPTIAQKAGIEGRVFVQFVVDEEGNVIDPTVIRGIGAGCDEEAIRAVTLAKFTPGTQRGKAVKVKMTLPVMFKLDESSQTLSESEQLSKVAEQITKQIREKEKLLAQMPNKIIALSGEDRKIAQIETRATVEHIARLKKELDAISARIDGLQSEGR